MAGFLWTKCWFRLQLLLHLLEMTSNQTYRLSSTTETQKLAETFGESVQQGTVLALIGDLGSGKTTFTQGFAKGFGVTESVGSPTFKIVSEYNCRKGKLVHVDCYRLKGSDDFLNIDGESILNAVDAVTLIEWADIIQPILPPDTVYLRFSHCYDDIIQEI